MALVKVAFIPVQEIIIRAPTQAAAQAAIEKVYGQVQLVSATVITDQPALEPVIRTNAQGVVEQLTPNGYVEV